MRILLVGSNYAPEETGIAPYTTGIAEHFAGHGHAVTVLTGFPSYPESRVYDGYGRLPWKREAIRGVSVRRSWRPVGGAGSAAGGWLVLMGLVHSGVHVWMFVLENGLVGQREFAMKAMKQAYSLEPLQPTMWTTFRAFSVSFSLLLLFSGSVGVMLSWIGSSPRVLRSYALLGTVFWTAAFVPFVVVED